MGEAYVEKKNDANSDTKSAKEILKNYEKYKVKKCIKLGEYNVGEKDQILTIPYYMAFLLQ